VNKLVFILVVALLQLSASIEAFAAGDKPQFLFVQSAKSMKFSGGVLTLQGVSPMTVFFSDRPKRIVGHVRNDLFVNLWSEGKNSFKKDPPNAALFHAARR
jgi:hypothetical protein